MRLLVTGREGQLAMSLAAAGPGAGWDVILVGRPELDLSRPDGIAEVVARYHPDVVVNAAAYTAVDKAESEPDMAMAINAAGAEAVARACSAVGSPVIHISTDYVFPGTSSAPYGETDPTGPTSAYGASKLAGEHLVRQACAEHLILRTAWVHSPWGNNFVKTMLRIAKTRNEISVVDDQQGSPTYAPHLAEAILSIAGQARRNAGGPWGTFHAAGSGETTWCGLAREVFRVSASLGGPRAAINAIATAQYPTPASRPANSRLDCAKLRETFAVSLPSWTAGVEDCVNRLLAADRVA